MTHETTTPVGDGLRALADILDKHPELINGINTTYHVSAGAVDAPADLLKIAKAIGGQWDKRTFGDFFSLERDLGGGVKLSAALYRDEVCERVEVGTEKVLVPAEEQPDLPPVSMVEVERPKYEWRCPGSLLALVDGAVA